MRGVIGKERSIGVEASKPKAAGPVPLELEALYQAYGDMVYRLALVRTKNRADAEDVLQDVFFRCLRRQPVFTDENHQKAWLITVTIRSSKNLLTSAARRHEAGSEPLEFLPAEDRSDGSVYEAVMNLPGKYRTAVHLFYYEGYSVEEIGRMTGANPSTVKSHLYRAREALRRALKEEDAHV